ncbi:MAG: hypothetical protein R2795_14875 [Saprospiraceae bacterium]
MTRIKAFTNNATDIVSFLQAQQAGGGGDYPEAVDVALEHAMDSLVWRENATTRIAFWY